MNKPTSLDERLYQNKDTASIAGMLKENHIPFIYQQATILYGEDQNYIAKPTFSLPTYGAVIEYVKEDEQQPLSKYALQELYRQNYQEALILNADDLQQPGWQDNLCERLATIYQQQPDRFAYDREKVN
jgi:hypothetical protein